MAKLSPKQRAIGILHAAITEVRASGAAGDVQETAVADQLHKITEPLMKRLEPIMEKFGIVAPTSAKSKKPTPPDDDDSDDGAGF